MTCFGSAQASLLAVRQLTIDDRGEGVVDPLGGGAGYPCSRGNSADVFGRSQRMPVGIERFPRGSNGTAVAAEQPPAPLAYEVFICVELGHRHLLRFEYEHMFAWRAAAK